MEPETTSTKTIPSGYTFMGHGILVSEKAKEVVLDLLDKAEKRNPDAQGMYVYNDYYSYALHNLAESLMISVRAQVIKKNWVEAYHAVEALTIFLDFEPDWTHCDDGELTRNANKLYSALLLSVLKGLKDANQLDPTIFPSLETVLRVAYDVGKDLEGVDLKAAYVATCKAIANRLFKDTTAADQILNEARHREFVTNIEDAEQKEMVLEGMEQYLEKCKTEKPWFLKGKIGQEEYKDLSKAVTTAWNKYKAIAPNGPFRGPPEWDITKWTDEDKKPFMLGNRD